MAYPVIPLPEGVNISVGSELKKKTRTLKAEFGGGYTQRTADGINSVRGEYSVVFDNLTRAEATVIDNFFEGMAGFQAFEFTRPGEATSRRWICEEWTIRHVSPMHDSVVALFIEVFDP